jgi:hypothetical protein
MVVWKGELQAAFWIGLSRLIAYIICNNLKEESKTNAPMLGTEPELPLNTTTAAPIRLPAPHHAPASWHARAPAAVTLHARCANTHESAVTHHTTVQHAHCATRVGGCQARPSMRPVCSCVQSRTPDDWSALADSRSARQALPRASTPRRGTVPPSPPLPHSEPTQEQQLLHTPNQGPLLAAQIAARQQHTRRHECSAKKQSLCTGRAPAQLSNTHAARQPNSVHSQCSSPPPRDLLMHCVQHSRSS